MGFSYRVGKGVRIRVSSRGVRTRIGPRGARIHVGGGRTGFSTGAGPVTYYTSLGGGRSRSSSSRSIGASQRQLAQAQKVEEAQALAAAIQQILNLHRSHFPDVRPPLAAPPEPVDETAIRKRHERAKLAGIGFFKRAQRAEARRRAGTAASEEIAAEMQRRAEEGAAAQAQLDQQWQLLLDNDPTVVLATLEEAFEDNDARAAPLDVENEEVEVVVLSPPPELLPERMPATTSAGNLTLKKMTKADRATLYRAMVFGHVVATVRETFPSRRRSTRSASWRSAHLAPTPTAGRESTSRLPLGSSARRSMVSSGSGRTH